VVWLGWGLPGGYLGAAWAAWVGELALVVCLGWMGWSLS